MTLCLVFKMFYRNTQKFTSCEPLTGSLYISCTQPSKFLQQLSCKTEIPIRSDRQGQKGEAWVMLNFKFQMGKSINPYGAIINYDPGDVQVIAIEGC